MNKNFKSKFISGFFCIIFIFTLMGCKIIDNKKADEVLNVKNVQYLTATVYNATISNLENKEVIEEKDIEPLDRRNNNINYDKIKVVKGFAFKAILDFNLEPYFEKDYTGQEIEIIISLFELHSTDYDSWYEQKMIILKTDTEIAGFLCPQYGSADPLNNNVDLSNLYFESAMLLTKDAVVKYYEKGDRLYSFKVNLSNKDNITMDITTELAFETERENLSSTVIKDSLIEIDGSEVLELMDMAKIQKVDIKAKIEKIDNINGLLYVTSEDVSTLKTVEYNSNHSIYDLNGNIISYNDLSVGDVIKIYYYKRYNSYKPVNIIVNEITVEKTVNEEK